MTNHFRVNFQRSNLVGKMVKLLFGLIVLLSISFYCEGLKLPEYLKKCKLNDPELNKCAVEAAKKAIPFILKGDPKYEIPVLSPFFLPSAQISTGSNLDIFFQNATVRGLETIKVSKLNIDNKKNRWEASAELDFLEMIGQYDMNGKILVLPIVGTGPGNITLVKPRVEFSFDYDIVEKKNKKYMSIKKDNIDFKVSRAYYKFDNLFNGDKRLGDEMNRFLNDNWEEINKDLGPAIGYTAGKIMLSIVQPLTKKVPYSDIFEM